MNYQDVTRKFIHLSDGATHYQLSGDPNNPTVVLIHGIAVPFTVWQHNVDALVEAGYRVLSYDLYGRGNSDRPRVRYNEELFSRQLHELLVGLEIPLPVDLIGMSLGGLIATVFTDLHTAKIGKLCLIDPVGFDVMLPIEAKIVQAPLIGEIVMKAVGERVILRELPKGIYNQELIPEYIELARPQLKIQGFKRAFLSTLRELAYKDMSASYRRVGNLGHPTLLIWGQEDGAVPISISEKVQEAMPKIEFHAIQDAGHLPHYEKPQVVNPILVEFLQRK